MFYSLHSCCKQKPAFLGNTLGNVASTLIKLFWIFTLIPSCIHFASEHLCENASFKACRREKTRNRLILNPVWPWPYQNHSMFYTLSTDGAKGQMERLQRLRWEVTLTRIHQNKLKCASHIHAAVCRSPGEWGKHNISQPRETEPCEKPGSWPWFAPEERRELVLWHGTQIDQRIKY